MQYNIKKYYPFEGMTPQYTVTGNDKPLFNCVHHEDAAKACERLTELEKIKQMALDCVDYSSAIRNGHETTYNALHAEKDTE